MEVVAVVLAAGKGTRMRSKKPKVLHKLLGQPMLQYGLEIAEEVTGTKPVVVVGQDAAQIRQAFGDVARYVVQETQLGTGHALQQSEDLLRGMADLVLVLTADMPLLTTETLKRLVALQQDNDGPLTMLTLIAGDSWGFGRVMRDMDGHVEAVIEEAVASPEQLAINELNAGVYCFRAAWLWEALRRVPLSPKGEHYLTDTVNIAVADGFSVQALVMDDPDEAIGINTRVHLAEAQRLLRIRINHKWMLLGVTIMDSASTYIEPGVEIGQDTVIWPNTYLEGGTTVGKDCALGPNTIVNNSRIGNRCKVYASVVESAVLDDDVNVGPFGHLRKGAHLAQGVHMGNFGEIKNSYLGQGVKIGHFSYIGDATIGKDVNIGAGTITCNFDGKNKNSTEIGEGVFIGSDTMLVAPVKLGDGARTGAGSVVTKDVPANTLAVGAPARSIRKLEKGD